MTKEYLNTIKNIYERGENIIKYLKGCDISKKITNEMVMVSYDFQAGSYIKNVKDNPEFNEKYTNALAKVIKELNTECGSILEVGVGEATTLANLIPKLKINPKRIYGFDLSWSRIRYAVEYIKNITSSFLFVGDLFHIPLADNSIDIVYSSHSIEPNGGREKEALLELMRITNKYLILLEPAYEFASVEAKKRMEEHGYIKNLYSTAISLGLHVIEHRLFDVFQNFLNPTGIMVIEKDPKNNQVVYNPLICPITKTSLKLVRNSYFTKEGMLAYPIIDEVPCLLKDNAVIATHYIDDFKSV